MGIITKSVRHSYRLIEKERMSGQRSREAIDYEATVEEIKDNIKSTVGETVLKNGTFGDLEDKTDALQEATSQFQPKKKEDASPKKKRSGSDTAVAEDDDELQIVTEIKTSFAKIGTNMSRVFESLKDAR